GSHPDRALALRSAMAHGAAQRQPVDAGNHDVEDQEVEPFGFGALQRFPAIAYAVARVALEAEMQADRLGYVGFVLYDEDSRRHCFVTVCPSGRHVAPVKLTIHSVSAQMCRRRRAAAKAEPDEENAMTATIRRIAFGGAAAVLALGVSAGLYASAQNTNQDP